MERDRISSIWICLDVWSSSNGFNCTLFANIGGTNCRRRSGF